jgi:GDP-mannose 6-dehydrogenase
MICWRFVGSGLAHSCDDRQTIENRDAEPVDAVAFDERTSGGPCTARQCRDVARRDLAGSHWRRREGSTDRAIAVRSVHGSQGMVAGPTPRRSNQNETRLPMNIAVFGLGYVGCVTAACLARHGHSVVGVDTNEEKVRLVNAGRAPVLEPGLGELIAGETRSGRLVASSDPVSAVTGSNVSMICVGTPSAANGSLALHAVERVARSIGDALPECSRRHTVVVRSTVLPGTTERSILPVLEEASGLTAGTDFGLSTNPEFLREGVALADFERPPKTVIGQLDARSGEPVEALYGELDSPCFRVPIRVAEMVKYVDNAFHALKITFANEVGTFCRAMGIDSHDVMEPFLADRKLNISEAYLKPGFSFGGSCLPKDLRALVYASRRADLDLPLLESILPSNERHFQRTLDVILALGRRRVGMLGLAFKPGIDDLRESPLVELAEALVGKGYDLRIYDPAVSISRLVGANRQYMVQHLPHLSELLVETVDELVDHAELVVVGGTSPESARAVASHSGRHVIDLVRLEDASLRRGEERYVGVAW